MTAPRRPSDVSGSVECLGDRLGRLDADLLAHRHGRVELTREQLGENSIAALAIGARLISYVQGTQDRNACLALLGGAGIDAIADALDRRPDQVRDDLTDYIGVQESVFKLDDRYGMSPAQADEARALIHDNEGEQQ